MLSFEQRKLIAQLERDMKELGLTVDYSEMAAHHCIVFEVEGYNRIIIWLSNDCFLSLNLSNNPQFAKVAPKVLYIANKFMENYRKIDMEVTHGKIEKAKVKTVDARNVNVEKKIN